MTKHISADTCTLLAKSFVTTLQQHLLIITGFFQKHSVNKPVEKITTMQQTNKNRRAIILKPYQSKEVSICIPDSVEGPAKDTVTLYFSSSGFVLVRNQCRDNHYTFLDDIFQQLGDSLVTYLITVSISECKDTGWSNRFHFPYCSCV